MSIEDLGNLGDFISSIAVVISLLYLALQVRSNTEAARTTTYQAVVSDFGDLNRAMAATPELSSLFVRALEDFGSCSEDERARMSQLFFTVFHCFENMYYQNQKGYLETNVWLGWKRLMLAYYSRPGFQFWWSMRRDVFSKSFADFLSSETADIEVPSYLDVTRRPQTP